ncbi:asparagine synthase [Lactobacillus ultunensis DSM 16047]|nr:asparagine synthase [Lactobacillus ultunensis DSM 16047]
MAHSLELRVPYLDKRIAELANTIPTKYLVNKYDTKYALRKAAEKVLPDEWAKRPKLGFPTPIKQWLKEERFYKQVRNLFTEEFVNNIFDQKKIVKLLDQNYQGDGSHRRQIWTIYTFLVWYKLFFIDYENTVEKYQRVQPEVDSLIKQGRLL